jgi:hypothetical protein
LNTDFGNTITLLFGLVSPPITDAECIARANLIRDRLAELRQGMSSDGRAALAVFFPPSIAQSYRETISGKFETAIRAQVWQKRCGLFRAIRLSSPIW